MTTAEFERLVRALPTSAHIAWWLAYHADPKHNAR